MGTGGRLCVHVGKSDSCVQIVDHIAWLLNTSVSDSIVRRKAAAMSSTSQKHRDFVGEPMGEKPVTSLAGIGPALGMRLSEKGFDKAYVVLGQYLVLKKNEELFKDWLKEICGANKKQQGDCHYCLREWCNAFL